MVMSHMALIHAGLHSFATDNSAAINLLPVGRAVNLSGSRPPTLSAPSGSRQAATGAPLA
jgi:hypothetical protein